MKKYLLFAFISLILLTGIGAYQYIYFHDEKLHVVFCDVGQGDAIFIRTPDHKYILVDGGPDKSVLNCLAGNMGFWERSIDLIILTHPHQDHFFGLNYVLDRLITLSFDTERLSNNTASFHELSSKITRKKIPQRNIFQHDRYELGKDLFLTIESPSREFLQRSSPNGEIGETGEFASLIMKLTYKDFDLVLTGDAQTPVLEEFASSNQKRIEVLQVPHHGSATGLSRESLEKIDPKIAVISVGEKNMYGHPKKEVLNMLEEKGVGILRTDRHGNVEIVSDGKRWLVK